MIERIKAGEMISLLHKVLFNFSGFLRISDRNYCTIDLFLVSKIN